jgi:hypothetical protein
MTAAFVRYERYKDCKDDDYSSSANRYTRPAHGGKEKCAAIKGGRTDPGFRHLSSAASAALLAKPAEASETFAQTIKEAATGDAKAQAILAKN